jgi:hypothetical protein
MSRRSRRVSYELLGCGWHGHALVGTDAAAVRQEDDLVIREQAGPALAPLPAVRRVAAAAGPGLACPPVPAGAD